MACGVVMSGLAAATAMYLVVTEIFVRHLRGFGLFLVLTGAAAVLFQSHVYLRATMAAADLMLRRKD